MSGIPYYYNVPVFTADLKAMNIFVGPGSAAKPIDESAAARLVQSNLEELTGGRGGHIMPTFAKPSREPPKDVEPTKIDGLEFYVTEQVPRSRE
jgi:hypothetical protein